MEMDKTNEEENDLPLPPFPFFHILLVSLDDADTPRCSQNVVILPAPKHERCNCRNIPCRCNCSPSNRQEALLHQKQKKHVLVSAWGGGLARSSWTK
ncbi:hypothetical protein J3F84DRAFT_382889 [Trichoderma pleuroticola]